jgi:hypothetical protein
LTITCTRSVPPEKKSTCQVPGFDCAVALSGPYRCRSAATFGSPRAIAIARGLVRLVAAGPAAVRAAL